MAARRQSSEESSEHDRQLLGSSGCKSVSGGTHIRDRHARMAPADDTREAPGRSCVHATRAKSGFDVGYARNDAERAGCEGAALTSVNLRTGFRPVDLLPSAGRATRSFVGALSFRLSLRTTFPAGHS
jgi:hypothetical protein